MSHGAPLRFLAGSVGGWVVLRLAATMLPGFAVSPMRPPMPHVRVASMRVAPSSVAPVSMATARVAMTALPTAHADRIAPAATGTGLLARAGSGDPATPGRARVARAPAGRVFGPALLAAGETAPQSPPAPSAAPAPPEPTLAALAPVPRGGGERRWSGSAWLFARGDGGGALAPGGQLGGGQAGARVAYRLPDRLALAARVSGPLRDGGGAEAAAGVDWRPFGARVPLRVSIERRIALGPNARNAWSAYAAGGFYRAVGGTLVVDGYAQAGVVGARRGDLFADGAVRAGARLPLPAAKALTLGAGVWGAAQPHAARLDIGPRAALGLPLGPATATLALEARIRVAGATRPGTGLALTLAADF